jgi:hypothetical protein
MGTMSLNFTKKCLAACLAVLLWTAPAFALYPLGDMELFAPPQPDEFGGGVRANEGLFVTFDLLNWYLPAPQKATIGDPDLLWIGYQPPAVDGTNPPPIYQRSLLTTAELGAESRIGERWDIGSVSDHQGWLLSTFNLHGNTQRITSGNVPVVFAAAAITPPFPYGAPSNLLQGNVRVSTDDTNDNDGGALDGDIDLWNLPVTFKDVVVRNRNDLWSVEFNYMYRAHPTWHFGTFEFLAGVRYMEFNESFDVDAFGGILDTSRWYTDAENHIVGPQLGLHWFNTVGRWTWDAEGRFFAGFNNQNITQTGQLGSNLTPNTIGLPKFLGPTTFSHSAYENEFSPGAELRINLKYQLTRAFAFRVGWSGMWIDGIARPNNMVSYVLDPNVPNGIMGINRDNNRQDMLVQGVNFGLEFNR